METESDRFLAEVENFQTMFSSALEEVQVYRQSFKGHPFLLVLFKHEKKIENWDDCFKGDLNMMTFK